MADFMCDMISKTFAFISAEACKDNTRLLFELFFEGKFPDISELANLLINFTPNDASTREKFRFREAITKGLNSAADTIDGLDVCMEGVFDCLKDPIDCLKGLLGIKLLETMRNIINKWYKIKKTVDKLQEELQTFKECQIFTYIYSADVEIDLAFFSLGQSYGIFYTVEYEKGEKVLREVGLVEGYSFGMGASFGNGNLQGASSSSGKRKRRSIDASIGLTYTKLWGDINVINGWGYSMSLGLSFPTPVTAGISVALLFESVNGKLGSFSGFSITGFVSAGIPEVAIDISVSCSYDAATSFWQNKPSFEEECPEVFGGNAIVEHEKKNTDVIAAGANLLTSIGKKVYEFGKCMVMFGCKLVQCVWGTAKALWDLDPSDIDFSHCESSAGKCANIAQNCINYAKEQVCT